MASGRGISSPASTLLRPSSTSFVWATGIENTCITAPWPATGRTLDEYELTDHDRQWRRDLDLMASLGVRAARYGVPWHRVQPAPRRWDWSLADRAFDRLLELGIDPIVDLVHYGLPPWIDQAYLHLDYPHFVAEYAARFADRFRGRIRLYTPLNEPRITAWYCGKIGWWPPQRRGWGGFVQVMLAVCRGIVETVRALKSVDSRIVTVHVDAADVYRADDPSLRAEAQRRQAIGFLALDLVTGRVTPEHELYRWLTESGVARDDLRWFGQNRIDLPVVGLNLYPMFSNKRLVRTSRGLRIRAPYADGRLVERIAALYWRRYRVPLFISETASVGSTARRSAWLNDSVAAVRRLRERSVPIVGYTWWPMFSLVTWGYRQCRRDAARCLMHMGLWDLQPSGAGSALRRVPTPLVEQFRALVSGGASAVGALSSPAGGSSR